MNPYLFLHAHPFTTRSIRTFLVIAMLLSSIYIAYALISTFIILGNNFTVLSSSVGLKTFADPALTIPLSSANLGNLTLGSTNLFIFYLLNTGDSNLKLNMTTIGFPTTPAGWSFTWNREGFILLGHNSISVTNSLTIPPDISVGGKQYSFLEILLGTQS